MQIEFYKYQGTGNDFIMIDNRELTFPKEDSALIAKLCHRKFGIGADGLICIDPSEALDFNMIYFNADGKEGSMCGNGGRCTVAFAHFLGIIQSKTAFNAVDGLHEASIHKDTIRLKMGDVNEVSLNDNHIFLDTGSPHHVEFVEGLDTYDVYQHGKRIRYGAPYQSTGTNVNFVEQLAPNSFKVRTYERGVEDETLSCGTGVTAVAIAGHKLGKTSADSINLETLGGSLKVSFTANQGNYQNVFLEGKASAVFKGTLEL